MKLNFLTCTHACTVETKLMPFKGSEHITGKIIID
jgi:hypothetical protein